MRKKVKGLKIPRTIPILFLGETYNVTYNLGAFDMTQANWTAEHGMDRNSLLEWLQRIVLDLDLEDDEGAPVPVTVDALTSEGVPTPFMRVVKEQIEQSLEPSKLAGSPTPTT